MIDRIVLHIGTHKTGTTAIQSSLRKGSRSPLGRAFLYPEAGRARGVGHAAHVREGVKLDAPPAQVSSHRALLEEVDASRRPIPSSSPPKR
jgi:hypothetical protein